jgi:hypothetical protein
LPWVPDVLVLSDFVVVSFPRQKRYPRRCGVVVEDTELVLVSLPLQKWNPRVLVAVTSLETRVDGEVDGDDDKKLVSTTTSPATGLWLGCGVLWWKDRRRKL